MGCMAGYTYRLAYRHADGVQGFVGSGTTPPRAKADAISHARRTLTALADNFDPSNVISSTLSLPTAELAVLNADWKRELGRRN